MENLQEKGQTNKKVWNALNSVPRGDLLKTRKDLLLLNKYPVEAQWNWENLEEMGNDLGLGTVVVEDPLANIINQLWHSEEKEKENKGNRQGYRQDKIE